MAYHNSTCGCAECGNYGQIYNPTAIHNQSCGCSECGNYGQRNWQSYTPTHTPEKTAQKSNVVNGKVRVYDLAKELKLENRNVIEDARRFGVIVSVPSNVLDDAVAEKIRSLYFPNRNNLQSTNTKSVSITVQLDPDIAQAFPDSESINQALRSVIKQEKLHSQ